MTDSVCARCGEAPPSSDGLCAHCHWAIRTEVEVGLLRLAKRLEREAEFADWLAAHPEVA